MNTVQVNESQHVTGLNHERVAIFVDYENLFIPLRDDGNPKIDYKRIWRFSEKFGRITLARVYTSNTTPNTEGEMRRAGFDPRYVATNGRKVTNVDTQMIVDMMRYNADIYIVVAGDLDFEPAVRRLREEGKIVVVVHLVKNTSCVLKAAADEFQDYRLL